MNAPLTLGTAGHIDHGKTALVGALTGVQTDRLPEERARGLTIVLGYAPLVLPSGRRLSVVDVPGHERFVRTMVAGATGIDAYIMVVAADDGAMPQTREHAAVLRALGVREGVVAVTKCDAADPGAATEQARELLPGVPVVACSARTGEGIDALRAQLDALAARVESRAAAPGPARLHVDRVFTVAGRGTVVTGTLWAGALEAGAELELLPAGTRVRVRGLQVHDEPVERAAAGQRVAVNLAGVRAREVARGDVLATPGAVAPRFFLDCALQLLDDARHGERVHVHHGTRDVPARLAHLADDLWQLRLDRPVLARDGDRVVVRRPSPPDTLGGGVVLDAAAGRHGRRAEILERLAQRRDGVPEPAPSAGAGGDGGAAPRARRAPARPAGPALDAPEVAAVEARLHEAGTALLSEAQLADDASALRTLRDAGRAVRVSGRLYGHAEAVEEATRRIVALLEHEESVTLAGVRDALGLSRKSAQALLEHLDTQRITRRLPDDRRVLHRQRAEA